MATKKPMTDEPFGKIAETGSAPTASVPPEPVPTAIPVVAAVEPKVSTGSASSEREATVNKHFADAVTYLTVLRDSFHDGQVQADFNQAIMATRTAHLWALQAVKNVS